MNLLERLIELLFGGIGDGLLDLPHHGWQHHGDIALPWLAEYLEPVPARQPGWQQHVQLLAPAPTSTTLGLSKAHRTAAYSKNKSTGKVINPPLATLIRIVHSELGSRLMLFGEF